MQPSVSLSQSRLLDIDGTFNLRDVGGYRADGGSVAWQRLYRSDGLFGLTDAGLQAFEKLGIRQVIDLRDDEERGRAPNRLPVNVEMTPFPIFPSANAHFHRNLGIFELTELILHQHASNVVGAISVLSAPTTDPVDEARAALVHCTAGKDRTGAVIALTLTAVGVARDDVLHDYAETEKNLAGTWLDNHLELVRSYGVEVTEQVRELVGGSPIPALDKALKSVEHEFGSVRDYLLHHGLPEDSIARLHARLVQQPPA